MFREGEVQDTHDRITGKYEVRGNLFYYKRLNAYEYFSASNISDECYHDDHLGKEVTIRSNFNNHVILMCERHQCLIEIKENGVQWEVIEHSYGGDVTGTIYGQNFTAIMAKIKANRHQTLNDFYHSQNRKEAS